MPDRLMRQIMRIRARFLARFRGLVATPRDPATSCSVRLLRVTRSPRTRLEGPGRHRGGAAAVACGGGGGSNLQYRRCENRRQTPRGCRLGKSESCTFVERVAHPWEVRSDAPSFVRANSLVSRLRRQGYMPPFRRRRNEHALAISRVSHRVLWHR